MVTTLPPTPLRGIHPQVPPELLYLLLEAVGGSLTVDALDFVRYDPVRDAMEVIEKRDPWMMQIRFTDLENRGEPYGMRTINLNAKSVQIEQVLEQSPRNLDPNILPTVPTQGWRLLTPDGVFYFWSTKVAGVPYAGWWELASMPCLQEHIRMLRYTPDGRWIG